MQMDSTGVVATEKPVFTLMESIAKPLGIFAWT